MEFTMHYRCKICDYIIQVEDNDADSEKKCKEYFKQLPEDWTCPQCGAGKNSFVKVA
jgi:rubredoxin